MIVVVGGAGCAYCCLRLLLWFVFVAPVCKCCCCCLWLMYAFDCYVIVSVVIDVV